MVLDTEHRSKRTRTSVHIAMLLRAFNWLIKHRSSLKKTCGVHDLGCKAGTWTLLEVCNRGQVCHFFIEICAFRMDQQRTVIVVAEFSCLIESADFTR